VVGLRSLHGFQDEVPALAGVDAAEAGGASAVALKHPAFEDIIAEGNTGPAAARRFDSDDLAKTLEEALQIGERIIADCTPTGDKGLDRGCIVVRPRRIHRRCIGNIGGNGRCQSCKPLPPDPGSQQGRIPLYRLANTLDPHGHKKEARQIALPGQLVSLGRRSKNLLII
jgi:hypothetical protein